MKETKNEKSYGLIVSIIKVVRLFQMMGRYRALYLIGWILSLSEILISYLTPELQSRLVSYAETTDSLYLREIFLLIGLFLLLTPVVYLGSLMKRKSVLFAAANMKKKLFSAVLHQPVQRENQNLSDLIGKMNSDVGKAYDMFNSYSLTGLVEFCCYVPASLVILWRVDLRFALIGLFCSVLSAWLSVRFGPYVRMLERDARKASTAAGDCLIRVFQAMPVVRIYQMQQAMGNEYAAHCDRICRKRVRFRSVNGCTDGVIYLVGNIARPICCLLGVWMLGRGEMTVSEMVYAVGILELMSKGTSALSSFTQFIQSPLVAQERFLTLLDTPQESDAKDAPETVSGPTAISAQGLSYRYPDGFAALQAIDLTLPVGTETALVGKSGCGKSTLMKVLSGLYPADGEVLYFDRRLAIEQIRSLVTVVPQQATLFKGTVRENLELGCNGPLTEDAMRQALAAVDLLDWAEGLPEKWDTDCGEQGGALSGGQKQRLCIARAILRKTPLLMLDEPTAALDSASEQAVQKGMAILMRNRTTLMIAHRLSTIEDADQILVMEQGRIAERGSHAALLAAGGLYKEMVEVQ